MKKRIVFAFGEVVLLWIEASEMRMLTIAWMGNEVGVLVVCMCHVMPTANGRGKPTAECGSA